MMLQPSPPLPKQTISLLSRAERIREFVVVVVCKCYGWIGRYDSTLNTWTVPCIRVSCSRSKNEWHWTFAAGLPCSQRGQPFQRPVLLQTCGTRAAREFLFKSIFMEMANMIQIISTFLISYHWDVNRILQTYTARKVTAVCGKYVASG